MPWLMHEYSLPLAASKRRYRAVMCNWTPRSCETFRLPLGGVKLRIWKDRQWRINALFIVPFLLAALTFVGLNIYKHIRYSTLTFSVQGHYRVMSESKFITTHYDISSHTTSVVLHTSWFGSAPYMVTRNGSTGWLFVIYPTVRGSTRIANPPHSQRLGYAAFDITTPAGAAVEYLQARHWYQENDLRFEYEWGS